MNPQNTVLHLLTSCGAAATTLETLLMLPLVFVQLCQMWSCDLQTSSSGGLLLPFACSQQCPSSDNFFNRRLRDILEVRVGKSTDILTTSSVAAAVSHDVFLSVITKHRSLDLQAETQDIRDKWVIALTCALSYTFRVHTAAPAGLSSSSSLFSMDDPGS